MSGALYTKLFVSRAAEDMEDATPSQLAQARAAGRIEGQLAAIEAMQSMQNKRMDAQDVRADRIDKRIGIQEKISWSILGAIFLITSSDVIQGFISNVQ